MVSVISGVFIVLSVVSLICHNYDLCLLATQTISVGFIGDEFSGKEGDEIVASVKVEVPKDFDLDDFNETLTIVVTSKDGEAEGTYTQYLVLTVVPATT